MRLTHEAPENKPSLVLSRKVGEKGNIPFGFLKTGTMSSEVAIQYFFS